MKSNFEEAQVMKKQIVVVDLVWRSIFLVVIFRQSSDQDDRLFSPFSSNLSYFFLSCSCKVSQNQCDGFLFVLFFHVFVRFPRINVVVEGGQVAERENDKEKIYIFHKRRNPHLKFVQRTQCVKPAKSVKMTQRRPTTDV